MSEATPALQSPKYTMLTDTMNQLCDTIFRLFLLRDDLPKPGIIGDRLVVYSQDKAHFQLRVHPINWARPQIDTTTLVVYVDGACRGNGTPHARASYGVFFGPGSVYNTRGLLPEWMPQTSTRAEIEALAQALSLISYITERDTSIREVTIASDSVFVVDAMSELMDWWVANDGIGSHGHMVAHYERLLELRQFIDDMEHQSNGRVDVQVEHVYREQNRYADALANLALETCES